jgi:hypothetical protein
LFSQHLGVFGLDEVVDADRDEQIEVIRFEADATTVEDGALHPLGNFWEGGAHVVLLSGPRRPSNAPGYGS